MLRIYGVEIDKIPEGKHVNELTEDEKINLAEHTTEIYTPDAWFRYLNDDGIDTENFYWFPLNW